MRIGLDLDGTVLGNEPFFEAMASAMTAAGHEFYCISSHGRDEWPADSASFNERGFPHLANMNPSLMNPTRHGHLSIKGAACNQCDYVFDDDQRLRQFTTAIVFSPLGTR